MEPDGSGCVVCGWSDKRALFDVHLVGGERTVLCGSHALMHRRARKRATTVRDLVELLRDRRGADRRGDEVDELGARLSEAFAADRRSGADRRAG
jgi:hypothetical protein